MPRDHKFLSYRGLESDGKELMKKLLEFTTASHITSVNLMTCLMTISKIARCRPQFMSEVVGALESLHANLPPTLAKSQVTSVRKSLKQHLLALLPHAAAVEHRTLIKTLLTDLGATAAQVQKVLPDDEPPPAKKQRAASVVVASAEDEEEEEESPTTTIVDEKQRATDHTAEFVKERLTKDVVVDMVLVTMAMLPESMPPAFQSSFTPIAAAGTEVRDLLELRVDTKKSTL